ncbi:MAG: hypothetical protein PHQ66_00915 [Candidatus Nanoarchaeia archaeon]|nr:hypothetical protein [Candidatus Nanoarchaeia archaeon]MDD5358461.1 hypothetical protein [Candidatus Nanoarchaeia archaeon]MDD5588975.1 hypothetical protein [Candidatus Nanoarchaeia archaeon]
MWQDITLAIISVVLNFALVPQIIRGFKTKKKTIVVSTGLIFFVGVYLFCFIYLTLDLYFSALTSFISGTLWFTLFVQSIIYGKN